MIDLWIDLLIMKYYFIIFKMETETSFLGQITENDCWISSTILAIFLTRDRIPNITITGNKVIFPNRQVIILNSVPNNYIEGVIRATRVYFSKDNIIHQKLLTNDSINYTGCPDLISELFFQKKFEVYCKSYFSIYNRKNTESIFQMLYKRKSNDIFLITFNFNPDHLYVYSNMILDLVEVIDISHGISLVKIPIKHIYIVMRLDLKI